MSNADDRGAIPQNSVDEAERSITRPGGIPGSSLPDRVLGLEWWRVEVERRLGTGVAQFTELKSAVNALQPKPRSFLSMLPFLVPVIILAGTMLWQAARYPDRKEFEAVRAELWQIRLEQVQSSAKLDLILKGAKP